MSKDAIPPSLQYEMGSDPTAFWTTPETECIEMDLISVNTTVGPEDVCAPLHISGVLTRRARSTDSTTKRERSRLTDAAMIVFQKEQTMHRKCYRIQHKGSPNQRMLLDTCNSLHPDPISWSNTIPKSARMDSTRFATSCKSAVLGTPRGGGIYGSIYVTPFPPSILHVRQ